MNLYVIAVIALLAFAYFKFFSKKETNQHPKDRKKATSSTTSSSKKPIVKNREIRKYTREEVSKHNSRDDCWLIVDNKVYDVTSFVDSHPGGDSIFFNAGKDNTTGKYLNDFYIC